MNWLVANAAQSFGYILSSLFESETAATAIAPVFAMPMLLFGGLFANNNTTPAWLAWFQYISPIKYAAEGILDVEMINDPHGARDKFFDFLDYELGMNKCIIIFLAIIFSFRVVSFFFFKALIRKFQ